VTDIEQVDDLDTAKQVIRLLSKENRHLADRLSELARAIARLEGRGEGEQMMLELSYLKEQVGLLRRKHFGDSSERREHERKAKARTTPKGHGPRSQPSLPIVEVIEVLPEDKKNCPKCDGTLEEMKGVSEDSEFITRIEREYRLVRERRQKYRCKCGEAVVTAPSAAIKATPGGRYDVAFAAGVVVDKYVDHQPLERQCRTMAREGLSIDSQTLWDQVASVAQLLVPSYLALRNYILGADIIGADETWWRLMGGRSNKRWWAWSITTHDACWYKLAPSRSADVAKEVLGGFEGIVLCDGYKAYETVQKDLPNVRLAHCWAHARRHFVEAEPNYPKECEQALDFIGKLFEIERELASPDALEGDEKSAAIRARKKARKERSRPVIDTLRTWALEQRGLPKSGLRKAIDYMLSYWIGLTAFLDEPLLDIDNNRTERALRGMVIGRKNHYGSRSEAGTQAAAILYSLVESAKLCGVDPSEYLMLACMRAIEKDGSVLLPHQTICVLA
jgi:transposase